MKRRRGEGEPSERDARNAQLRAYGYHWKRTEQLTEEQWHGAIHLLRPEDSLDLPPWTLLSSLDMPVDELTILRWLEKRGSTSEEVLDTLAAYGFVVIGKDERGIWRIETPQANETINRKQALEVLERIRIDQAEARQRAWKQKIQEAFKHSATSLKETLDLYGSAQNTASAWGYSPYPYAEREADGAIRVSTYHFEGEWREKIFRTPEEVVRHLYADGEGTWNPGEWTKPA
jgi:hypothetical protein